MFLFKLLHFSPTIKSITNAKLELKLAPSCCAGPAAGHETFQLSKI
jgi:hypothetical protein